MMRRSSAMALLVSIAVILLSCAGIGLQLLFIFQVPFYFVFGWIPYLFRVVPQVTVSPSGVTIGLMALGVSVALCHVVTSWLWNSFHPAQRWRLRWTILCYGLFLLTCTAGICIVSITHQSWWIISSPNRFIDSDWRMRDEVLASSLASDLQATRSALARYRDDHHGRFPTLAQMTAWSVLTSGTDDLGTISPSGQFGPYLQTRPSNPFTHSYEVLPMDAPSPSAGWAYDQTTGDIRAILTGFHIRNIGQAFPSTDVIILR